VTAPPDILDLRRRLKAWLFEDALPLWWNFGTDHARGGFFEKLTLAAEPVEAPRRSRVAARQTYVYAQAGRMGWDGPWREAVAHGLAVLNGPLTRPDGLLRYSIDAAGAPVDDSAQPYEQAFGLLALSAARQALGPGHGLESRAQAMRATLAAVLGRPDGGVHDDAGRTGPLRANPLMHLFEAALAWREAGDDGGWADLSNRIARLARERLIQPSSALPELFDLDWRVLPEAQVEPGHQFEWGFLLLRHAYLADNAASRQAARGLIALAERVGVDNKGIAIMALDQGFKPVDRTARLWPQTERTRAGALLAGIDTQGWAIAGRGARGLLRYLETGRPGLWFETMEADGSFRDEASPASTLYHIVGAIQALDEACLKASS
jgi:mannose/cellobiose epimerase-like protein (N-acyl-D-glucosamine 2-epimerase family)